MNETTPSAIWRRPEMLLFLLAAAMPLSFSTWQALLNNFAIERVAFTGVEIGVLQSLREIPGFLAFAVVFLLLVFREQTLGYVSLLFLGLGVAVTGLFPTVIGLYITTVVMSIGFHYFETVRQSLVLQWIDKEHTPEFLGRQMSVGAFAALLTFGAIYVLLDLLGVDMVWVYAVGGGATLAILLLVWLAFPHFPEKVAQHRKLILRRRYWLFYALTFMQGARRQIFVVFAGFLMVEKFGFDAASISLLFLINVTINMLFAPAIGRMIGRLGERTALTIEYIGLIAVFSGYALVETAWVAAGLYVLDHLFFAITIALKTYFQKIADPADIASTAGVSFSINHIAAVVIPAVFGLIWVVSPAFVFWAGAGLAAGSLVLARLVPPVPAPDRVSLLA